MAVRGRLTSKIAVDPSRRMAPLRQIGSFAPAQITERHVQPRYAGTRRERNHHAPTCANAEYQILRVCCGVVTTARRVVVGRAADRRIGGNQISTEQRIRIGSPSPVLSLRAETCVHGDHGVGRGPDSVACGTSGMSELTSTFRFTWPYP